MVDAIIGDEHECCDASMHSMQINIINYIDELFQPHLLWQFNSKTILTPGIGYIYRCLEFRQAADNRCQKQTLLPLHGNIYYS